MADFGVSKRVMLISPNFGGGGAERSIANLSILLSEKNHDVHFVIFNVFPGREQVYPIKGQIHLLNVPAGKSFLSKGIHFLQRIMKVRDLKRKLNIDVCISYLEGADYVNILSKRNEKTLISIRGSKESDEEIRGYLGWLRKKILMPWLYKKAHTIVSVSEGIRIELENSLSLEPGKIKVIHNYYDIDSIQTLGKDSLPRFGEELFKHTCIVSSGRLHPQKNHAGLIRSFGYVRKHGYDVKLIILGSGELQNALVELCRNLELSVSCLKDDMLNVDADVLFLGYQKNPWKFMSRARIFVLSSSWEGFPNALAEAMCLGLPVISTLCPHGPAEILSDDPLLMLGKETVKIARYGVLVPLLKESNGYIACAEAIERLLTDADLCSALSYASLARMKSFTIDRAKKDWQSLIDR